MDLILSIVLVISISVFKISVQQPVSQVKTSVISDEGTVQEVVVNEDDIVVGNNLMLKRVPRAYHKILDELGLS